MTDQYVIKWQIADRAAQQAYEKALFFNATKIDALKEHMRVYAEIMTMFGEDE